MHVDRSLRCLLLAAAATSLLRGAPASAQSIPRSGEVERNPQREQTLLQQVTAPEGFDVTLFAGPPAAMYPACLATAPDGAVFVCTDPNLSLSRDKGRGRVVRLVDDNGDGHADRYTVFAEMDSPRGVVVDGNTVFVMHPPSLTAYRDTDGDGVADESEELVRGLGFDLDFRGADHTTNNIAMGIDGWLYVAVGDYGFREAVGRDGTRLQQRGGSVVRVRPDGTGLELYNVGTRNIYDVAVSPTLQLFARDNTNDGDGWNTRLHFLPAGAEMGYPSLYRNFADEHMPPLVDYGPGAGTGGLWLHSPVFPEGFGNTLYTADWTLSKIYRHPLRPAGATYEAGQEEFLAVPRPADLAIDGEGNLYVSSLHGGSFTYAGDTVGYVVRVRPEGAAPVEMPLPGSLPDARLLEMLTAPDAEWRLHAQREILRRGAKSGFVRPLERLSLDRGQPPYARVAAMFTLKQLVGERSHEVLRRAATDPAVRALALRALADRRDQTEGVPVDLFEQALSDPDPIVQLQAITGLVRLGARDRAAAILPLTASSDPAVKHVAVEALVALNASDAALAAVDGASPEAREGALRALRQMHDPAVVRALVDRLGRAQDPELRRGILLALARLHSREGEWKGDWWGTKPAFAGPYFAPTTWEESARIRPVLRDALLAARGEEYEVLVSDLIRNRVLPSGAQALLLAVGSTADAQRTEVVDALLGHHELPEEAVPLLARLDARSPELHSAVAQLLAGESALGEQSLPLVRRSALDAQLDPEVRSELLTAVSRLPGEAGLDAAARLFARLNPAADATDPVTMAWRRFVGDRRRAGEADYFIGLARAGDPAERVLAYSVLVQSVRSSRTPQEVREKVEPVLAAAWADPAAAPSLVQAITTMRVENQYEEQLQAYRAKTN